MLDKNNFLKNIHTDAKLLNGSAHPEDSNKPMIYYTKDLWLFTLNTVHQEKGKEKLEKKRVQEMLLCGKRSWLVTKRL